MKPPIHSMKKTEILWLANHNCSLHGHSFLEHYNCYLKENPRREKIGFYDIECSNLNADYGIMLCYCILDYTTGKIIGNKVNRKDLLKCMDKKLVQQCINDLLKFDRIVGFYSSRFDLPFIRTRALNMGVEFPGFGTILHNDIYFWVRNRFKMSSNRLENACRVLLGDSNKTKIDNNYWIKSLQGDQKSINYVYDHCTKDVIDTKRLYEKIMNFSKQNDTSI